MVMPLFYMSAWCLLSLNRRLRADEEPRIHSFCLKDKPIVERPLGFVRGTLGIFATAEGHGLTAACMNFKHVGDLPFHSFCTSFVVCVGAPTRLSISFGVRGSAHTPTNLKHANQK